MGDVNANVGEGSFDDIVGQYGLGNRNKKGTRWIEYCAENGEILMNTWFKQHPRRIYTRRGPGDRTRNQIDYLYSET